MRRDAGRVHVGRGRYRERRASGPERANAREPSPEATHGGPRTSAVGRGRCAAPSGRDRSTVGKRRERVPHERLGARRNEDLAAVRGILDPCRQVHIGPEDVSGATADFAGVNAHPHSQRGAWPLFGVQGELRRHRRPDGVGRPVEDRQDPVAPVLADDTAEPLDLGLEDGVMTSEGGVHDVGVVLPAARRILEVREHDRHQPPRRSLHPRYCDRSLTRASHALRLVALRVRVRPGAGG